MTLMRQPLFLLILLFSLAFPIVAMAQDIVREIRVNGTERVEPATVMTYLDVKMGDPMTDELLDRGLKNLFATGLFADVKLHQERGALIVDVIENPVINQIALDRKSVV